jgi:predicted N-acetyltransferase YhbS
MMQLTIDHLFNHIEHIPQVADWIYTEFWADQPGYSPAFFERLLRQANDPNKILLALVALVAGHPAGTINLIANDDPARPHLAPWLAALVVAVPYRGRGIGTRLVQILGEQARRLGHGQVFLGTDQPAFYSRLGATFYEQASTTLQIMRLPTGL